MESVFLSALVNHIESERLDVSDMAALFLLGLDATKDDPTGRARFEAALAHIGKDSFAVSRVFEDYEELASAAGRSVGLAV